jgi:hypothetical protein
LIRIETRSPWRSRTAATPALERAVAVRPLDVRVVALAGAVVPDRDVAQPGVDQRVDAAVELQAVGGDVRLETPGSRVRDHRRQIGVQQRLTAVEPHVPDARLGRVVEQVANERQRQLLSRHELAAVAAAQAAQVAARRHRDVHRARLGAHQRRQHARGGEARSLQGRVGRDQALPERGVTAQARAQDAA